MGNKENKNIELDDKQIEEIISGMEHRDRLINEYFSYVTNKQYKKDIDNMEIGLSVSSDDEIWDEKYDNIFNFLYNNITDMVEFEGDIRIYYKDKVVEFGEMHGQGCYRYINVNKKEDLEDGEYAMDYFDLLRYAETGIMDIKYRSLKAVARSMKTLDCAIGGNKIEIDGQKIDLERVFRYLVEKILVE